MLKVEHLTIQFSDRKTSTQAVTDVSFSMEENEILGIVGESGSGKTVTALSIAGIPKKGQCITQGALFFDGTDLLRLSPSKLRQVQGEQISMIFQEPMTALNPTMKIGKQVEEALLLHTDLSKGQRREKVLSALRDVELSDPEQLYDKYPHQLSGGMRQRVMIAAAIVCRPRLLIADEPTTALDVKTQAGILALLKKLNQKYGMGILFISHNLRVVRELCQRILVMKDGKLVEEGTKDTLFTNPKTDYTKKLIRSIPKTAKGRPHPAIPKEGQKEVLQLLGVSAYYNESRARRQILDNVSFTLYEGEITGLVGESGSGKSTLCKCILGLLPDYEGKIIHHANRPQMVFQDPYRSLNPRKRIGWILEEPLRAQKKWSGQERREKVLSMLQKVHLSEEILQRYPGELSGGQRQRISIALALITGTRLILADEPLSALDVTVQAQMIELFRELQKSEQITCLFVSHDLDVVNMLCQRVLHLEDGCITELK